MCTKESDFNRHVKEMPGWFLNRNYPKKLIDDQLNRVKSLPESQLFERKTRQNDPGVPLVVTFHPLLSVLVIILYKHLALLYVDENVKNFFTLAPFVSFRSVFSLSKHLVRYKAYPLERKRDKKTCKRCENVNETTIFKSSLDNKEYNTLLTTVSTAMIIVLFIYLLVRFVEFSM